MRLVCETAELAVECLQLARTVDLALEPTVPEDGWLAAALAASPGVATIAVAVQEPPLLESLVELAETAALRGQSVVLAAAAPTRQAALIRGAASDLGLCIVSEVEELMAVLALRAAGAKRPWAASLRGLPSLDRHRLKQAVVPSGAGNGHFVRADATRLAWRLGPDDKPQVVGRPRDVAAATAALQACHQNGKRVKLTIDGVDRQQVLDVLFGPPRALSDPASKAALLHYELPMPQEELCASASRAAAEAARLGFPVRIALASPDLRIWDHPDLAFDPVDSAAGVRDAYRQLMALAANRPPDESRGGEARLLGVTVTARNPAHALLGVRCTALPHLRVATEVSFADEHGRASDDRILTVLPTEQHQFERILKRLDGSDLLLIGPPSLRAARIEAIASLLLHTAAFTLDCAENVSQVELRPVAVLVDGGVEVREACVKVNEAFARSLSNAG